MKEKRQQVVIGLGVVAVCMCASLPLWNAHFGQKDLQEDAPPVYMPERIVDLTDCLVEVTSVGEKFQYTGGGVLVTHYELTFIVTSTMVFPEETDVIVVETSDGELIPARLYSRNEKLGLVALMLDQDDLPGLELNDDPNLPPGVEATAGIKHDVTVLHYLTSNPDWMILGGGIPGTCTGSPLIHQGGLAGIVIGVNRADESQAIAAGNHALREFADSVSFVDVQDENTERGRLGLSHRNHRPR